MATETQDYPVGSTVVLGVQISKRNTRVPVNPATLVLDALLRTPSGAPAVPIDLGDTPPFIVISEGYCEYRLDTTGYDDGTYVWRVRATDGTELGVALQEATFVLSPITT